MSGDASGAQITGRMGEHLPYPFLKIKIIVLIMGKKNALIVFIHELNVPLCSHLKCCFKIT